MRKVLPAALLACSTLALAAGCGSSSSSSSASSSSAPAAGSTGATTKSAPAGAVLSGVVPIAYRNIAISPETIKVKVGSTIKWTNYDAVEHNVTSQGGVAKFASKDFGQGGTYSIRITKPGVTRYECTIHPASMKGTIEAVQ